MFMCTIEFGTMPEILLTISGILAIIFFVSIGFLFVYIIVILIIINMFRLRKRIMKNTIMRIY